MTTDEQPANSPFAPEEGDSTQRDSEQRADACANDPGAETGEFKERPQAALGRMLSRRARRLKLPRFHRKTSRTLGVERTLAAPPSAIEDKAEVTCIDYGPDHVERRDHIEQDLGRFLAESRPEWTRVRWINVDGLHDAATIHALAEKYGLHPLAIEDVLHIPQRPKVDQYPGEANQPPRLFIVLRMLKMVDGHLRSEQVSIFLGRRTVLTFQEGLPGDVWETIRQRITLRDARLRQNDASFLLYTLLDAVVDECFPILDHFGDRLEELEVEILTDARRDSMLRVHEIRRELLLLHRQIRPMRELIHSLSRDTHPCLSDETRTYLRDVYDHVIQSVEFLETYHELAMNLAEMVNANIANRVNDVMKVLTMIATIFIPISFLTGLFGMNFEVLPGQHWRHSFLVFAAGCAVIAGGMLLYFRRKRWL